MVNSRDVINSRDVVNSRDMLFLLTVEHLGRFYDELNQMMCDINECQFHIERFGLSGTAIKKEKTQALDALSHAIETVKNAIDDHTTQSLSSTSDHTNTIIDTISDIDVYCSEDKNGIKTKSKEKKLVASGPNTVRFHIQSAKKHLNYRKFINQLTKGWISLDILLKNHDDLKTASKEHAKNSEKTKKCVDLIPPLVHPRRDIFHKTLNGFQITIEKSIQALDQFLNTVNPLKYASMDCNEEPLCFVNLPCRYPPNQQAPAAPGLILATAPSPSDQEGMTHGQ